MQKGDHPSRDRNIRVKIISGREQAERSGRGSKMKSSRTAFRSAFVLCLFLKSMTCWSFGASCDDVKDIPSQAKEVASGVVNPSPFVKSFTAGQRVFVKVRNDTVHLTPATVTIAGANGDPEYCVSALDVPPQKTLIFSTAVFGERISWQVRVEPGDVDVVQLTINVYALPAQKR